MASTHLVVLALAFSSAAALSNISVEEPQEQAKAASVSRLSLRWTGRIVPYVLDPSVLTLAELINRAMLQIMSNTCVRFVPRTLQQNFIKIFSGEGCYHRVGMIGGEQPLSLGNECMNIGSVVHHLMGSLGFFYENDRTDRDNYVVIYWGNIQAGQASQFFKIAGSEIVHLTGYDYDSTMHLGSYAFSGNGQRTMDPAESGRTILREVSEKSGLSGNDIQGIRGAYNC